MTPDEWYRKNFGGGFMGQDIGGMKLTPQNTASVGNVSFGPQGGASAGVTGTTQGMFGDAQIPTTPMEQSKAGVLDGGSFDFGKLATALGGLAKGPEPMQAVDTRPKGAGQQIQPIQIYGGQPQGVSGAMSAIQQGQGQMGIGGAMDPEMLRRMRGF